MEENQNQQNINISMPKNWFILLVVGVLIIAAIMLFRDVLSPGADIVEKEVGTIKEIPAKIRAEKKLNEDAISAVEQYYKKYDYKGKLSIITEKQIPPGNSGLRYLKQYKDYQGDKRIVLGVINVGGSEVSTALLLTKDNQGIWHSFNSSDF